jgi:hypothetical protein
MNATAIPVAELIGQLLDAANGIQADTAAAGLIISHQNFLHRNAFRRIISTGASISTGQPLATIGWDAALRALDAGQMPCASSEQAILRIAASLGDPAISVRLRTVLGNLDAATSPWSLTLSPPPTANPSQLPGRPGPQNGCRTPVLAFIRSAGRSGSPYPADLVT